MSRTGVAPVISPLSRWDSKGLGAVGAAWSRLYRSDASSFGYVDDFTAELAIGVLPDYRGKGMGSMLLQKLMSEVAVNHNSISRNVRASNPAVRLYERLGFMKIQGSDIVNRVGGHSFNMIAKLGA
jgi:ribosomal protein S18 acetylase RimI-like enzyme